MKLSEAMRKGAKAHPQISGEYSLLDPETGEHAVGTCAIGAAYYAVFNEIANPYNSVERKLEARTGAPLHSVVGAPAGIPVPASTDLADTIILLNDQYGWTREQIADWLEGIGY